MRLTQHISGNRKTNFGAIPNSLCGTWESGSLGSEFFCSALWGTKSRDLSGTLQANALWGTISAESQLAAASDFSEWEGK